MIPFSNGDMNSTKGDLFVHVCDRQDNITCCETDALSSGGKFCFERLQF